MDRDMKISVIVPVYKVEPYLRKCVDSVLGQTFKDFELILVDDGSPDNCGKICDEYAAADDRVKVIHQANGGLSAARNAGIDWVMAYSKSEYITFIDSDDWVADTYLERLYEGVGLGAEISVVGMARAFDENTIASAENPSMFNQLVYRVIAEDDINIQKGAELLGESYEYMVVRMSN